MNKRVIILNFPVESQSPIAAFSEIKNSMLLVRSKESKWQSSVMNQMGPINSKLKIF